MKNILLVGCGHMGSALLTSWLNSKNFLITVIDPFKYKILKQKFKKKIKVIKSISDLNKKDDFDFIVFATKPIDLDNAISEISNIKLNNKTSIISVVAGKKINIFKSKIKNINNIFRVMPNMPALIGEGMNCIVASKKANKSQVADVQKLFSYSGKTILFKNEDQIDMATAISGSGPGFIFYLIDAMENAALKLGFNSKIAKTLVLETFKGSIDLILKYNLSAKQLADVVATKGGTTEAGINILKKNKIHKIFKDLTKASYKIAKRQGKLNAKK